MCAHVSSVCDIATLLVIDPALEAQGSGDALVSAVPESVRPDMESIGLVEIVGLQALAEAHASIFDCDAVSGGAIVESVTHGTRVRVRRLADDVVNRT